jgi:hypothetical protein
MSSAEQVRKVLLNEYRELTIEDLDDGGAVVRDTSTPQPATASETGGFPVTETLYRCADLLADSGFAVALVRDAHGVYLNAR